MFRSDARSSLLCFLRSVISILALSVLFGSLTSADVLLGCPDQHIDDILKVLPPSELTKSSRVPFHRNITGISGIKFDKMGTDSIRVISNICAGVSSGNISLAIYGEIKKGDARVVADILDGITQREDYSKQKMLITANLNSPAVVFTKNIPMNQIGHVTVILVNHILR